MRTGVRGQIRPNDSIGWDLQVLDGYTTWTSWRLTRWGAERAVRRKLKTERDDNWKEVK